MHRSKRPMPVVLVVLLCLSLLPMAVFAQATTPNAEVTPGAGLVTRAAALNDHPVDPYAPSASDDHPYPQAVFGADDRVRLSPPDRRFVMLDLYDTWGDLSGTCSGTLVSPDVVLTAAHCLYDSESIGGWVTDVGIWLGKDGNNPAAGFTWATYFAIPTNWIGAEPVEHDWGLIILDDHLGNAAGWLEMVVATDSTLSSGSLNPFVIGYPADKPDGTQWYGTISSLHTFDDYLVAYMLDTYSGQSGASVVRASDNRIIAVHSGATDEFNFGVRITHEVIGEMVDWCAEMGCSVSYVVDNDVSNPGGIPNHILNAFDNTWARTDWPVADRYISRTWMWGPEPLTDYIYEDYLEGPSGQRLVIYQEKSRMELTVDQGIPSNNPWFITNGLLSKELITGLVQIGHNTFEPRSPAQVNVAGDFDDPTGPTYATFAGLLSAPALDDDQLVVQRVDRAGNVTVDNSLAVHGVSADHRVIVPGLDHQVASVFWGFMHAYGPVYENGQFFNSDLFLNPFYATGLPITEAYWARVRVGGVYKDVLMQCFERRCLTYTPGNPAGWEVEAGNVGTHYFMWRYGRMP